PRGGELELAAGVAPLGARMVSLGAALARRRLARDPVSARARQTSRQRSDPRRRLHPRTAVLSLAGASPARLPATGQRPPPAPARLPPPLATPGAARATPPPPGIPGLSLFRMKPRTPSRRPAPVCVRKNCRRPTAGRGSTRSGNFSPARLRFAPPPTFRST